MNRLFSPWRSQYISSFRSPKTGDGCLFCDAARSRDDAKSLVFYRQKTCYAIMNLFPYNSGHAMVVPLRHTSSMGDLSRRENAEILATASDVMEALTRVMKPDGFNFGANLGRAAGAGIDRHIHFHIVPRWNGDTNFMPILSDTKLVSEDIRKTFGKLRAAMKSIRKSER